MFGDIPILLLLLSQTLVIEPLHLWLSTIVIIGIISGWAYRNGLVMGKKADIDKVVSITQYNEDNKDFNDRINSKADASTLTEYMKLTNQYYIALHERMDKIEEFKDEANKHYIAISGQLGSINKSISNIEKNCDKQTCKK